MSDIVNIVVYDNVDNVNVNGSSINEIIDINITEISEDVSINVTEQVIQVNITKTAIPLSVVNTINGLNGDVIITKSTIGLSNIDNTSDLNKPLSTATINALLLKENSVSSGNTSQYYRGDKSWQTLDKSVVGLSNVDNVSDSLKPISIATQSALDLKENNIAQGLTSQYFRGDKTWQTLPTYTLSSLGGQPLNSNLTTISNLVGNGFLKRVNGTYTFDTNAYITSITSGDVTSALGFTPVTSSRTITINGTTYDLSQDRSWTISGGGGGVGTETDPIYTASSWFTTINNSTNWNTAYGWGNHATQGYLKSYTETDTLASVVARGATTSNAISITNATESTTTTSGALIISGGIGVAKNAYIGGNLVISGNFTVQGTSTTVNTTNLSVTDSLIYLSDSQYNTDVLDIGIYGAYGNGVTSHKHTGIIRDASDGIWKLISNGAEPISNIVDFTSVSYDSLLLGSVKINGGTSSQFLKADGSLDSSTYLTSITSSNVTTALGYTPYNSTNPSNFISGITSLMVTNALGFTPYNSTNPNNYISSITSNMVTTALGFTPYNSSNPGGYISGINSSDVVTALTYTPQAQLNGTGFVKVSGTTISYDNSTYLTGITSLLVTNALGFTPYNATNPNGYISSITSGMVTTALGFTPQSQLSGTGFVKSTAGVISYDTNTYLTSVGIANLTATGTPSATTYLRGDNTWATISGGSSFNGTLAVGTATTAPLDFTIASSVLKTTPLAGDIEADANGLAYYSHNDSSRGVIHSEQYISLSSTYTLTSQTAAQKLFNSTTNGALTVKASTTYYFECYYSLTSMSATSGSFGFAIGGTATITSINWTSQAVKLATITTATNAQTTNNTTVANTTIATANTSTTGYAKISGIIRVNASGTIIPQVSLGVASAAIVGINSYFKLIPLGTNTNTSVGNWS